MRPHTPIVLLATVALALAAAAGAAAPSAKPEAREDKDKIVLSNEDITVWFHGKKPMLQVLPTDAAENASAGFAFKFHQAVEYRDVDGNGLPASTEILASLNLEKASAWQVNTTEQNGTVVLTLTLEAPLKSAPGVLPEGVELPANRTARVSLVFTIGEQAMQVEAGDVNLTVPTTAIKYDFVVEQWPTVRGADSRLALEAHVTGALEAGEILGLAGATVDANATDVGVVAWTDSATGVNADGDEVDVPVRTELETLASGEGQANLTATRIVHTFDAPELASLVYDPVIGLASASVVPSEVGEQVGDAINGIPSAGAVVAIAGIGAAVALAARRR